MTRDLAALRGPFEGTEGHLDAPYWQTPPVVVEAMLDLAALAPGEHLLAEARLGTRIVSHAFPIADWEPAATR